jgi:hypothetical protein
VCHRLEDNENQIDQHSHKHKSDASFRLLWPGMLNNRKQFVGITAKYTQIIVSGALMEIFFIGRVWAKVTQRQSVALKIGMCNR